MEIALNLIMITALLAVAGWELRRLRERPGDTALRILSGGLVILALAVALQTPLPFFDPLRPTLRTIQFSNTAWSLMAFCYASFFMLADSTIAQVVKRRKLALEFALFFLAISTTYIIWFAFHIEGQRLYFNTWWSSAFYVVENGYDLFAFSLGTWRAGRYRARLSHPWARTAIAVVMAGGVVMTLGVTVIFVTQRVLFTLYPGSKWPLLSTLYSTGRIGGQLLLALGLALIPLGAALGRVRARYDRHLQDRYRGRMLPLWSRLTVAFPGVVLPAASGTPSGRTGSDATFERITTEISDGLAHLALYIPDQHSGPNKAATTEPSRAAALICSALAGRSDPALGDPATDSSASGRGLEPDFGPSWRRRARWMAEVADQLDHRAATPSDTGVVHRTVEH